MVDRQEVDRADQAVGPHRVDDVLRVGSGARVVVDLGADREAHAPAQALGDDGRVAELDAGGFGRAVEVARLGELERAADEIDGGRILERQVVDVIGDHHEARLSRAARRDRTTGTASAPNTGSGAPRQRACVRPWRARGCPGSPRCGGRSSTVTPLRSV